LTRTLRTGACRNMNPGAGFSLPAAHTAALGAGQRVHTLEPTRAVWRVASCMVDGV
jgi:hypothetical protein